ncbi:hypothetical protein VTH06DRAFT_2341 [Thermothelomyces fergusii]
MKANTTWRPRLLLFVVLNLLLGNAATARSTCYNTRGEEDKNLQPCSATGANTGETTWCCARGDTCLSNGLCLSPRSSNLMMQQGCTDKNWGEPCRKYCPAGNNQKLTEIPLVPCPASFNRDTNDIKFCCGPDPASCCEASSTSWISLPAGTVVPSRADDSRSTSDDDGARSARKLGLGIGLGLGVPILLVLAAVAYLLAQPLHSRGSRRRGRRHGSGRHRGDGGGDDQQQQQQQQAAYAAMALWPPPRPHHDNPHGGGGGAGVIQSARSQATALAQWARSPFGFGGLEPPEMPREMDGSGRSAMGGGHGPDPAAAASPSSPSSASSAGGAASALAPWHVGRKVHVAAEEVELPTPDTPVWPDKDVENGLDGRK